MFNLSLNLGDLLIAAFTACVCIIGWFTKKELSSFSRRLDRHDEVIFSLAGHVQKLIGYCEASEPHHHFRATDGIESLEIVKEVLD